MGNRNKVEFQKIERFDSQNTVIIRGLNFFFVKSYFLILKLGFIIVYLVFVAKTNTQILHNLERKQGLRR